MTKPVPTPPATVTVPLSAPVTVPDGDTTKTVAALTFRRPRTGDIKALALIIGPDLVKALFADARTAEEAANVDLGALAGQLIGQLFDADRLNGLTDWVGGLADVPGSAIDDTAPEDMVAIARALAGFFPQLTSLRSGQAASGSPP